MDFKYEDYADTDGILRFAEIAKNFNFGPHLAAASFPDSFIAAYVGQFDDEGGDADEYFIVQYPDGQQIVMLEGIDSPRYIHSQNRILAESAYAEDGTVIMPVGYYSFGTGVDARGHLQLMVNLEDTSADYGKIYAWRRAHDALGQGDNAEPLGFVADNLQGFLDGLAPQDAL